MLFCGDIAIPNKNGIRFVGFPENLSNQIWVGNLEGSLIKKDCCQYLKSNVVFNSIEAIRDLVKTINYRCFVIANNHLLDAASVKETIDNLNELGVPYVGAGRNLDEAAQELVIGEYVIVAFGWNGISCIYARAHREGVNPFIKQYVIKNVESLVNKYKDKKIICYLHWNYELEFYPQPLDKGVAHRLIDTGAYAVIGCHAHRVQPIELYKGRPIVYGLGNFTFMQGVYMNGELNFPEYSYDEVAFEITDDDQFWVHKLKYNPKDQILHYLGKDVIHIAEFSTFSDNDYNRFFKSNRKQRTFLPIFYYKDSFFSYWIKISYVHFRQKVIDMLLGNRRLFNVVKKIISRLSR